MNLTTGEGTTAGWNAHLQSIPSPEAQAAIQNFYRSIRRPFSRPTFWDDAVAIPWQSGKTTVVRDVRVADSKPRRHNTCRVTDLLGRNGKRIPPQRTRDGLLPPILPSHTRNEDADIQELLEFLARYFMRENPSSTTEDHESDLLRQDDSIPARAYRDTWLRRENQDARRLRAADASTDPNDTLNHYYASRRGQNMSGDSKPPAVPSSDPFRIATERAKAMDTLPLTFHERLQAQAIETGVLAYFPEWRR